MTLTRRAVALAATALTLACAGTASATVTLSNAGFEDGTTTGWTGAGSAVTSFTGANGQVYAPQDGSYFATVPGGCATNTLAQTFTANAGDTVSGWAFFSAGDYQPFNDSGDVKLTVVATATDTVVFSSDVNTVGSFGGTPWEPFSATLPSTGSYTISIDSSNYADCAYSSTVGVDLVADTTPPAVAVTGAADGATYTLGSVPAVGCSTTDSGSGVAQNATLSTTGGPVGSVTATCSGATDGAGNTAAPVSVTYTVHYAYNGFFQPVDNGGVLNSVKAGSAVPVKFSLAGNQGLAILASGSPSSQAITCAASAPVDAIEQTSTAGSSSLTYDPTVNQYVYVWKTDKAWAGTCRQLTVKLADGTSHTANFKLTK